MGRRSDFVEAVKAYGDIICKDYGLDADDMDRALIIMVHEGDDEEEVFMAGARSSLSMMLMKFILDPRCRDVSVPVIQELMVDFNEMRKNGESDGDDC